MTVSDKRNKTLCFDFFHEEAVRLTCSYLRIIEELGINSTADERRVATDLKLRLQSQWRKHLSWGWDLHYPLKEIASAIKMLDDKRLLEFLKN